MKYLLGISYDGGAFHGWQVQPGTVTVQQTLQDACAKVFTSRPDVTGCSRTDSGVHAKQFFCTVEGKTSVPCENLPSALNALLPDELAVMCAREVDDSFHPRYSCRGKEYVYDISISAYRQPLSARYAWQLCRPLDVDAMRAEAGAIVGKHDFSAFCAAGSGIEDPVRTVFDLRVEKEGDHVYIFVSADGFLYNMVRIIVGTLVNVGLGRSCIPVKEIIASGNRSKAGPTAPAHGLYLNKVFYDSF